MLAPVTVYFLEWQMVCECHSINQPIGWRTTIAALGEPAGCCFHSSMNMTCLVWQVVGDQLQDFSHLVRILLSGLLSKSSGKLYILSNTGTVMATSSLMPHHATFVSQLAIV